jgi:hypothetical protein
MQVSENQNSVVVPAGEYYLGDPCYAVRDEDWEELLDTCDNFRAPIGTLPNRLQVFAFRTANGDGTFACPELGTDLDVDSGLIGLVPWEYADFALENNGIPRDCGGRVRFSEDTICINHNGVLDFMCIAIGA